METKIVPVTENLHTPFGWICFLEIEDANGESRSGTGFKIQVPDVNYTAVVTSAQCVYSNGAYASKITMTFPGQPKIIAETSNLYAPLEYINEGQKVLDYGLILLPGKSDEGFGWSTQLSLENRRVANCVFDKSADKIWLTRGEITSHTSNSVSCKIDTAKGQSGSPIYTWYEECFTVIAVHTSKGSTGTRFTIEMISNFMKKMNLPTKTLESVQFPNVFIRCDGSGVNKFTDDGGGVINCQYTADSYEKYYIYPPEILPSIKTKCLKKVVIESARWDNVFIRLDGKNMSKFDGAGGGVVNCQYGARQWEVYYLKEEEGANVYSIMSAAFPHCRIRVNGRDIDKFKASGMDEVNCQYYDDMFGQSLPWEKIKIVEC